MAGAASHVNTQFSTARSYASAAAASANAFITALNSSVSSLVIPPIEPDPTWPETPTTESITPYVVGDVATEFPTDDSGVPPADPGGGFITPDRPTGPTLPTYTLDTAIDPTMPVAPADPTVTMPTEPAAWTPPSEPTLLTIAITPFDGVDTHEEWLDRLDNAPADLSLAAPTPFSYTAPARYSSDLLTAVTEAIRTRLAGGTGLDPAVEQAIWDRARSREAQTADNNIDEVVRNAAARGFALPSGAMAAMLREAQKSALAKASEVSRDIAIKQADLEQENAKHAIEQGYALEGKLIEYANSIEQRSFEAARYLAENAVQVYNAQVAAYRVLIEKYTAYAEIYRTLIQAEQAKVQAYEAQVNAERAKVDVNRALIDQMRARIEVRNAELQLYRTQLEAVQTAISAEKLKIEIFGERVRAYVAEVNANTAKVEAFKAKVDSNRALVDIYKVDVDAYAAYTGALGSAARARADVYSATVGGYRAKVEAFSAKVSAAAAKVNAAINVKELGVKAQQLEVSRIDSANRLQSEFYRAQIGLFEAQKNLSLSRTKVISEHYLAVRNLVAEASKVGAQVNAQLAASAMGTARVSAGVQGSDQTNVSYSYSGATSDSQAAPVIIVA
jgi:hypothetical protein